MFSSLLQFIFSDLLHLMNHTSKVLLIIAPVLSSNWTISGFEEKSGHIIEKLVHEL